MSENRRSPSLEPPRRERVNDPGAHDLGSSDSDDHFSDAQSAPSESPAPMSPVPKTRVEKVDDEPAYGEVPGTEAYNKRTGDAAPDEIAIIPDAEPSPSQPSDRPVTPGDRPIPKTVVDEIADASGSETRHFHEDLHKADAAPDIVRKADGTGEVNPVPASMETTREATDDVPDMSASMSTPEDRPTEPSVATTLNEDSKQGPAPEAKASASKDASSDDFGDDFEEFEEGGANADFDDFDGGFQQAQGDRESAAPIAQPEVSLPLFPILDLDGLDAAEIIESTEPYLDAMFPPDLSDLPVLPSPPKDNPIFFNPRSASLWSQLVAPPPLQPPDWIRSRIRRLFLVSLGVPVDLDEILPASKQKKLILPSLQRVNSSGSPRVSSDSLFLSGLRKTGVNDSAVSVDSQGGEKYRSASGQCKKGPPPAPDLDLVSAKQLCMTTDEALKGMTDAELKEHVEKLKDLEGVANEVLVYWKKRTDAQTGDREAFEGVIENLVKHARKTRQ